MSPPGKNAPTIEEILAATRRLITERSRLSASPFDPPPQAGSRSPQDSDFLSSEVFRALRPFTAPRPSDLEENAPEPWADALRTANQLLAVLGPGRDEEIAPSLSAGWPFASDQHVMLNGGTSSGQDSDQTSQPAAQPNNTQQEATRRTDTTTPRRSINRDLADFSLPGPTFGRTGGSEENAPEPWADALRAATLSEFGSGRKEEQVPSLSVGGPSASDPPVMLSEDTSGGQDRDQTSQLVFQPNNTKREAVRRMDTATPGRGINRDLADLLPSALASARTGGLDEDAPEPRVDAVPRVNKSSPAAQTGQSEKIDPTLSADGPFAFDRPVLLSAATFNGQVGDRPSQPVAQPSNTKQEAAGRTDTATPVRGINRNLADLPRSAPASAWTSGLDEDAPARQVEAVPRENKSSSASPSGESETRGPTLSADGSVEHRDSTSGLPSGPNPSQDGSIPRHMPSFRSSLAIRMGQSQAGPRLNAQAGRSSSPPGCGASRSYGPTIPLEFRTAEVPSRAQQQHDAPTVSRAAEDTTDQLSDRGTEGSAGSASVATGGMDDAGIAALRPLVWQWLDSNMRRLLTEAIHSEMGGAKSRKE
jgi:hypothetical protein